MGIKEKTGEIIKKVSQVADNVAGKALAPVENAAKQIEAGINSELGALGRAIANNKQAFVEGGVGALGIPLSKTARLSVAGDMMGYFWENGLQGQSPWRVLGKSSLIGAGLGAVAGGVQGYFSDDGTVLGGALKGAIGGALVAPAFRSLRLATGATTYNPFSAQGIPRRLNAMWRVTSVNPQHGKIAATILGHDFMTEYVNAKTIAFNNGLRIVIS